MRRFILITGASSGIGEHAAKILINRGYEVIAGVRTILNANQLMEKYGAKIHPVLMDVTDSSGMEKAKNEAEVLLRDGTLVAIINNAGIVINGAVLYVPIEEWQRQFEVNVMGAIRTTQLFFPLLSKPKPDDDLHPRRIINISSVSGLFASPFLGPYAASKYALEALSDSLRRELYMHNIQVVLIEPGSIITRIWDKAKDSPSYLGPEYESILEYKNKIIENTISNGIPVEALDRIILKSVQARKVSVRYLVRRQRWKFRLILMLPAKWVDKMILKKLQQKSGIRPF